MTFNTFFKLGDKSCPWNKAEECRRKHPKFANFLAVAPTRPNENGFDPFSQCARRGIKMKQPGQEKKGHNNLNAPKNYFVNKLQLLFFIYKLQLLFFKNKGPKEDEESCHLTNSKNIKEATLLLLLCTRTVHWETLICQIMLLASIMWGLGMFEFIGSSCASSFWRVNCGRVNVRHLGIILQELLAVNGVGAAERTTEDSSVVVGRVCSLHL